jgi:hypothetical protein
VIAMGGAQGDDRLVQALQRDQARRDQALAHTVRKQLGEGRGDDTEPTGPLARTDQPFDRDIPVLGPGRPARA